AQRSMTVIQAVVTMGRGLGMDVVAEGVETEAEAAVLRMAGVNEIQGYYFSRPVAPEVIAGLALAFAAEAERAAEETAKPADLRPRLIRRIGPDQG
ncbi:MAG: EAL domain-containing protein, partial [Hyphomonadaceae bacterium]